MYHEITTELLESLMISWYAIELIDVRERNMNGIWCVYLEQSLFLFLRSSFVAMTSIFRNQYTYFAVRDEEVGKSVHGSKAKGK